MRMATGVRFATIDLPSSRHSGQPLALRLSRAAARADGFQETVVLLVVGGFCCSAFARA